MNGNAEQKGQTTRKTIAEIFGGGKEPNKKRLSIPNYQRDYAWGPKNFEDLWSDLQDAIKHTGEEGHFLNTLIVAPNGDKFDLIDGQQRMTTIFMLLYVLAHRSESNENMGLVEKNGELRLEVAEGNREFFREILEDSKKRDLDSRFDKPEKADTQGKENLRNVLRGILDYTRGESFDKQQAQEYFENLSSMYVIWHEEANPNRAIRVFHTINDRGVPLKLLDKLKALLMRYSYQHCGGELDDNINQAFGEIFKISAKINKHPYILKTALSNQSHTDRENSIFRFHAGSKKFKQINEFGNYDNSEQVYKNLKKKINELKKGSKYNDIKDFIEEYIKDLSKFYETFFNLLERAKENLCLFKLLLLEGVSIFFYNSLVRLEMEGALSDKILNLIGRADILLLKTGSYQKATAYGLINSYFNKGESGFIDAVLNKDYIESRIGTAIDQIATNAHNLSFSHYVFFEKLEYENPGILKLDLLKQLFDENLEKEHIMPQVIWKNQLSERAKKLGFGDDEKLTDFFNHMNWYGNFLSLEKKINAGDKKDKDPSEKAQAYKDSKIWLVRDFAINEAENFNKQALIKRTEEFKKWAREDFFKEFFSKKF